MMYNQHVPQRLAAALLLGAVFACADNAKAPTAPVFTSPPTPPITVRLLTGDEARAVQLPQVLESAARGDSTRFWQNITLTSNAKFKTTGLRRSTQQDYDNLTDAVIVTKGTLVDGSGARWYAIGQTRFFGDQARNIQNVAVGAGTSLPTTYTGDATGLGDYVGNWDPTADYNFATTLDLGDVPCSGSITASTTHYAWRQFRIPLPINWGSVTATSNSSASTSPCHEIGTTPTGSGGTHPGGDLLIPDPEDTWHCWANQERWQNENGSWGAWSTTGVECSYDRIGTHRLIATRDNTAQASAAADTGDYRIELVSSVSGPVPGHASIVRRANDHKSGVLDAIVVDPNTITAEELSAAVSEAVAARRDVRGQTSDRALSVSGSIPTVANSAKKAMFTAVLSALKFAPTSAVRGFGESPSLVLRIQPKH